LANIMLIFKPLNYYFILLLALVISLNVSAMEKIIPSALITADWLAENLDQVKILDVRKDIDSFTKTGHIDGAVLVNVKKIRVTRVFEGVKLTRMIPDQKAFDKFIGLHGINSNDVIVLTHQGNTPGQVAGAARLYWQFKYYGYQQVALLDGGNTAWANALEDLVMESSEFKAGVFETRTENLNILAKLIDVKTAMQDNLATLIDTRELRFHVGLGKRDYVFAYGHIPGSKNVPYQFLTPAKGVQTFLQKDELVKAFKSLNVDPEKPAIMYCNSAFECSSVWFVLHEILGNKKARIYDGSLHEWTMDINRPMTTQIGL